jgi:hypothetical protein
MKPERGTKVADSLIASSMSFNATYDIEWPFDAPNAWEHLISGYVRWDRTYSSSLYLERPEQRAC